MNYNDVLEEIRENPELVFHYLRSPEIDFKVMALDAVLYLSADGGEELLAILSDLFAVIGVEIIPSLEEDDTPESRGALLHFLRGIAALAERLDNKNRLLVLQKPIFELLDSPDVGVRAGAILALGAMSRHNPGELRENAESGLVAALSDDEGEIRRAAAYAWGEIALTSPKTTDDAVPRVGRLLEDDNPAVRAEAAGFFYSLAEMMPDWCRGYLPELRQLRDDDPDEEVQRRAGAAVRNIIK